MSSVALCCAAQAQTYDFSAATAQLSNNLALYPGGVFVQVFQDDTEIFTYQISSAAKALSVGHADGIVRS